jgi:two-component sensor histidine kinase
VKKDEIMNNLLGIDEFTLLKEMQHRMKNNLQLILSLINIQLSKNIQETNNDFLTSLKQRIRSLSLINNFLDHTFDESDLDLGDLVERITDNASEAYKKREDIIVLKYIECIKVDHQLAIPIGLIVNELLTNAMKYAFPEAVYNKEKNYCRIEVVLRKNKGHCELIISDNGISLNNDVKEMNIKSSGVKLVYNLVEQIDGKCILDCRNGTTYKITF